MKRYFILMESKKWIFTKRTNSLKIAKWFANLNIWTYAKIHDMRANGYFSKCIYVNDKRGS